MIEEFKFTEIISLFIVAIAWMQNEMIFLSGDDKVGSLINIENGFLVCISVCKFLVFYHEIVQFRLV